MFKESYPSFPEEWDNPENTLYREFYLRSSPDFDILHSLVKKHMSDKGGEGITKYRLMYLLKAEGNRAFYLNHQQHSHPKTWLIRWYIKRIKQTYHRYFKTKSFKNKVELYKMAKDVLEEMLKES